MFPFFYLCVTPIHARTQRQVNSPADRERMLEAQRVNPQKKLQISIKKYRIQLIFYPIINSLSN